MCAEGNCGGTSAGIASLGHYWSVKYSRRKTLVLRVCQYLSWKKIDLYIFVALAKRYKKTVPLLCLKITYVYVHC